MNDHNPLWTVAPDDSGPAYGQFGLLHERRETLGTSLTDEVLTIRPVPRTAGTDLGLECWGGMRKADLLAKLLDREVEIVAD